MRMRNKPWAEEALKENPHIAVPNPEQRKGKWRGFFKNAHPIHMEIGTGKGQFIAGMAKANTRINFIGVELQTSVIASALKKVQEQEAPHVALLNQNANDLLDFFASQELHRIYLNFSDPWPKNKHAKRRLTHHSFLSIYQQLVVSGGEVHLKTDNEGLFEFSLNSFADFGCRLKNMTLDLHQSEYEGNVMTEYEEKFSQRGMKIFRCEAILPTK